MNRRFLKNALIPPFLRNPRQSRGFPHRRFPEEGRIPPKSASMAQRVAPAGRRALLSPRQADLGYCQWISDLVIKMKYVLHVFMGCRIANWDLPRNFGAPKFLLSFSVT